MVVSHPETQLLRSMNNCVKFCRASGHPCTYSRQYSLVWIQDPGPRVQTRNKKEISFFGLFYWVDVDPDRSGFTSDVIVCCHGLVVNINHHGSEGKC